ELALGAPPPQPDVANGPTSRRVIPRIISPPLDRLSEPAEVTHLAAYLQLLGSPVLLGAAISLRPMDNLAVDIGAGWFDICLFSCMEAFVPNIGVSWLSGNNHNLELGLTASVILRTDNIAAIEFTRAFFGPLAGYRYQP